ncbi:AN1-type zinc finger protein 2A-like isoform X2 [Patiria miniata]|uniref:AN1-type domain-containing protein n=1 Tax=Patiria miniata TaxID=46514 RepID=A0A913ZZT6_PATMI|nr:AN1-type zinc finger protein 2A-like isoform X2 [Patiria miniata]
MEFPKLGEQCFVKTCKQLDFLPMKCDACSRILCKDHIQYSQHQCDSAYKKDVQVPVCPLCNKPIPVKRGEPPDIRVSQHIDSDCQSDPAKEKRKVFSNKCSLKGCKQKELVPVLCSSCQKNYCLRHRHTTDHDCKGFQGSGRTVANPGMAALNRAAQRGASSTGRSTVPQKATSSRNVDRPSHHTPPRFQQGSAQLTTNLQAGLSEDEAMRRAIQMSLSEQQAQDPSSKQDQDQEASDLALARALQESEREEQQRRRQEQPRARQQQSSDASKCRIA